MTTEQLQSLRLMYDSLAMLDMERHYSDLAAAIETLSKLPVVDGQIVIPGWPEAERYRSEAAKGAK